MTTSDSTVKTSSAVKTESGAKAGAAVKAGKKGGKAGKKPAKKQKRVIPDGIAHISASFNNTIVTITDGHGNVVAQASSAGCGFRGSRKSTPHAAGLAAEAAAKFAVEHYNMKNVQVQVQGPGQGREAAIRALAPLKVTLIVDVTPIPHNGCKNPKKRRV